ncbi:MAG: hypothetical protein IJG85_06540 [Eubacteriaceae bacterium]|nr:hypothetical protein [Eubacteriaceae bacterium]
MKAGYHSHFKGPVSLMLLVMLLICLILSPGAALAQEVKPEDKVKVTVKADKTDLKDDELTKVTVTLDNESDDILKYNSLSAVLPDYFELHEGSLSHYEETIGVSESKSYSFTVEADADGHDDDRDKKEDKDSDKDDDKDKDKKEVVAKVVRRDSGNPKTGSPATGAMAAAVFLVALAALILFLRKKYKASKALALILVFALCGGLFARFPLRADAESVKSIGQSNQTQQTDQINNLLKQNISVIPVAQDTASSGSEKTKTDDKGEEPAHDYKAELPMTVAGIKTSIVVNAHIGAFQPVDFPEKGDNIVTNADSYKIVCPLQGSTFVDQMADLAFAKAHIILSEGAKGHKITDVFLSEDKKTLTIVVSGKVGSGAKAVTADFKEGAITNVALDKKMTCSVTKPKPFIETAAMTIDTKEANDGKSKSESAELCLPVDLDSAQFTDKINNADFTVLNAQSKAIKGAVVTKVDLTSEGKAKVYVSMPGKTPAQIAGKLNGGYLKIGGKSINCGALKLKFNLSSVGDAGIRTAAEVKTGDDVKLKVTADKTDLKNDDYATVTVTMANDSDYVLNYTNFEATLPSDLEIAEGSLDHHEDTIGIGESKSYSFKVEADTKDDGDKDKDTDKDDDEDKDKKEKDSEDKEKSKAVAPVIRQTSNPKTGSPETGAFALVGFLIGAAALILFLRKKYKASKTLALILVVSLCGNFLVFFPTKANAAENKKVTTEAKADEGGDDKKPAQDYKIELPMTVGGKKQTITVKAHVGQIGEVGFPITGQAIASGAENYKIECQLEGGAFNDKMADASYAASHISLGGGAEGHTITSTALSGSNALTLSVSGKVKSGAKTITADFEAGSIRNVAIDEQMTCQVKKPKPFIDVDHIVISKAGDGESTELSLPVNIDSAQFTDSINNADFTGSGLIKDAVCTRVDVTDLNKANVIMTIPGKSSSEVIDEMAAGNLTIDGASINCDALSMNFALPVYTASLTSNIVGKPTITDNGDGTATITAVYQENVNVGGDSDIDLTPDALSVASTDGDITVSAPTNVTSDSFDVTLSTVVALPANETQPGASAQAEPTKTQADTAESKASTETEDTNKAEPDTTAKTQGDTQVNANSEASTEASATDGSAVQTTEPKQTDEAASKQEAAKDQATTEPKKADTSNSAKSDNAKSDTASTKATRTLSIDDYADLIMAMPTNLSVSIKKGAMTNASGFIVKCDHIIPTAAKW